MIRLGNISFSFGEKRIFDNFSLDIPDGTVVIGGSSGYGKTTLLRLISGLLTPDSGSITGVPKRISFMFQEDRLLPWLSAEKNIAAVLPKARQHEAVRFLDYVELASEAASLPEQLSGGQRRRISLARALAFDGELMLLDEPFKGFDPELTERMAALVSSLGKNIIMTSHSEFETSLMGGTAISLDKLGG